MVAGEYAGGMIPYRKIFKGMLLHYMASGCSGHPQMPPSSAPGTPNVAQFSGLLLYVLMTGDSTAPPSMKVCSPLPRGAGSNGHSAILAVKEHRVHKVQFLLDPKAPQKVHVATSKRQEFHAGVASSPIPGLVEVRVRPDFLRSLGTQLHGICCGGQLSPPKNMAKCRLHTFIEV